MSTEGEGYGGGGGANYNDSKNAWSLPFPVPEFEASSFNILRLTLTKMWKNLKILYYEMTRNRKYSSRTTYGHASGSDPGLNRLIWKPPGLEPGLKNTKLEFRGFANWDQNLPPRLYTM